MMREGLTSTEVMESPIYKEGICLSVKHSGGCGMRGFGHHQIFTQLNISTHEETTERTNPEKGAEKEPWRDITNEETN